MDKVSYTKNTIYNLFNIKLFSKTEIYNEVSGSGTEQIEIIVKPEYYKSEFDINKDDKKN